MGIKDSSQRTQVIERVDVPYQDYIAWQTEQIEKRKRNEVSDVVSVMTFSNSVYTRSDNENPKPIDLEEVILTAKRGGSDTWHGPGQIIVAPVIRLRDGFRVKDLTDFLEKPIRRVIEEYGVTPDAHADDDFPGVQVEGRKIAQLGLNLDDRVTSYGIAFNVTCDLSKFEAIDLCGIENCSVTNLSEEVDRAVDLLEVFGLLRSEVEKAFLYEDLVA